uniref:suppressor of fused domain protein n=1 Tax=Thaumasiovibrio occultus TaxID=1891184 RepID=UPI000B35DA81|nr:suppressor of fused domain protein [Thaumasiovibrio occultus]
MSNLVSLETLTSGLTPEVFQPELPFEFGGDLPLENISAYKMSEPSAHWLVVTKGFAPFGFELTMRVAGDEDNVPQWAVEILKTLARHAFNRKKGFELGNILSLNTPVVNASDCFLDTLFFVADTQLEANGELPYLSVAAITHDEALAARGWKAEKIAQLLGFQVPHHIIDVRRFTVLKNENIAAAVTRGRDADGSDTEAVPCGRIMFNVHDDKSCYIEIDALAAEYLEAIMPGRLPHGKPIQVISDEHNVAFIPSDECRVRGVDDTWVELYMTDSMYQQFMAHLKTRVKRFFFEEFEDIAFNVNDYYIKDAEGRTVGVKQWR